MIRSQDCILKTTCSVMKKGFNEISLKQLILFYPRSKNGKKKLNKLSLGNDYKSFKWVKVKMDKELKSGLLFKLGHEVG